MIGDLRYRASYIFISDAADEACGHDAVDRNERKFECARQAAAPLMLLRNVGRVSPR
jgi:hypothetical protein